MQYQHYHHHKPRTRSLTEFDASVIT